MPKSKINQKNCELFSEAWAIALRDIKKSFSIWKQALIIIITLLILIYGSKGLDSIIKLSGNQSYSYFFSAGMIAYFISSGALILGSELIDDKKGFVKLLLVAPISRASILLGKLIYLTFSYLTSIFIVGIFISIYLKSFSILNILMFLLLIIITMTLFIGFGIIIASFVHKQKTAEQIAIYFSFSSFFVSGILYPLENLPNYLKIISFIHPVTYVADLMKFLLTGQHSLPLELSIPIFLLLAVLLPIFAVYIFDRKQRE